VGTLKNSSFVLRIFFDHATFRFAAKVKLAATADQTIAFARAKLQGHGARKIFDSLFMSHFSDIAVQWVLKDRQQLTEHPFAQNAFVTPQFNTLSLSKDNAAARRRLRRRKLHIREK
jgi:hypothetical protein